FYAGALGLGIGRTLGLSDDRSVRLPFVAAHALTSSIVGFGLVTFGGLPVWGANLVATVFGLQSVRVLHNRTARYHALLDLLLAIGVLGLGYLSKGHSIGWLPLTTGILLLPQIQPLSGSLYSFLLGFVGCVVVWQRTELSFSKKLKQIAMGIVLPGLVTLSAYLILTRFWIPRGFGGFRWENGFRGIKSFVEISYSVLMFLIVSRLLFKNDEKQKAKLMWVFLAITLLVTRFLDLHDFSQTRYYLSIVILFLFVPFFIGWHPKSWSPNKWVAFLLIACLIPEMLFFRRFATPFHGIHVIVSDFLHELNNDKQPLRELISYVKDQSAPQAAIAADYVPQLVNWYFRSHPVSLIPTKDGKNSANERNPIWNNPLRAPDWHFFYPSFGRGHWNCLNHCDLRELYRFPLKVGDFYVVEIQSTNTQYKMCVVKTWSTNQWVNAPFRMYKSEALNPSGNLDGQLVLGKKCL
ncbi:MAG: hypothetical protein KDD61_17010, partial [Bdellovibrionales bacterium]|nr:hypothetical protein [Bdellovibrionales bacterium]